MSLAPIDWTWTYLAALPVRWQGGTGGCWAATVCYAMEMRAIIQGYPARQLAMRYNMWTDGGHGNDGTWAGAALGAAKSGVCLESLMPMPAYIGVDTTTQAYSTATWAAIQTPPSAAADADALNQAITDWMPFSYDGTLADLKAKCQAAIAAGYPLCVLNALQTHAECAWGFDDSGLIGLDSRSQNAFPFHLDWSQIGMIAGVVRGVKYANSVIGPTPTPLPKPQVIVTPPKPPVLKGNAKMLTDIVTTAQAALAAGVCTQAQKDAIIASATAIVPDVVVPPAVGDWTIKPGEAGTNAEGTWSFGSEFRDPGGYQLVVNGKPAGTGYGASLSSRSDRTYTINALGNEYIWNSTYRKWNRTT